MDSIRIQTANIILTVPKETIEAYEGELEISITKVKNGVALGSNMLAVGEGITGIGAYAIEAKGQKKNDKKTTVVISLPSDSNSSNKDDLTIFNSNGDNKAGKYNPYTGKTDAQIQLSEESEIYNIKSYTKDFSDISNKSIEMQEAIKYLAGKGIINGASETKFNPDGSMTRAEIASLITKAIGEFDANANGNFTDVTSKDWYCGAAGSAKSYGIISGYADGTFKGTAIIPKEQLVAISPRTLQKNMGYKIPSNTNSYLSKFSDSSSISSWAKNDISLAIREGIVTNSSSSVFLPKNTITRGEAAIIINKLFKKIW